MSQIFFNLDHMIIIIIVADYYSPLNSFFSFHGGRREAAFFQQLKLFTKSSPYSLRNLYDFIAKEFCFATYMTL